jgi:hypothetical protein
MREPSPRNSRLALAGSLAALIALGGGGFLLGRATVPVPAQPTPQPTPSPAETVTPPKVEVPVERTVGRQDLIGLGASAADAAASGMPLPASAMELVGKRFDISLPFGCDGPAPDGSIAQLRWHYDEKASVLRIHVEPTVWMKTDWWTSPPEAVEAMEGFWVERPWSSLETCPSSPPLSSAPGADPITLPGQTLGLVQLLSPDAPRQMQREGKPYEAVIRKTAEAVSLRQGLQLRLHGRVGRFPDGQPVRCLQPGGREQRPVCLIAVTFEEVAFQDPATRETLSVWQPTADTNSGDRIDE